MKIFLNSLIETEKYVCGELSPSDTERFEKRLQSDENLQIQTHIIRKILMLIKIYKRKMLKKEIAVKEEILFSDFRFIHFQNEIKQTFKS